MKYISIQVASIASASPYWIMRIARRPGMVAFLLFNRLYVRLGRYT